MTSSSNPVNKDTHAGELQDSPDILRIGQLSVDIAKITARDSSRIWDIIIRASKKEADNEELIPVIVEILDKQNGYCTLEEFLDAGNMDELQTFVGELVKRTMQTYKPILQRHPELFRDAPAKQTE